MPPKANTGIIKLRNAMSDALYEHKQSMPDDVYKKLYEALGNVTKQTLNKRWVKLHYIRASGTIDFDDDDCKVSQTYCTRNIQLTTDAIDRITEKLKKDNFAQLHLIAPKEPLTASRMNAIYGEIAKELSEEGCFFSLNKSYMIVKLTILE